MALVEASNPTAAAFDPRAADEAIPRAYNFTADIIGRNIRAGRADKPAYIDPLGTWTYAQLADRVERFGRVLRSLGIRREERILLALTDACSVGRRASSAPSESGVVPVPVNTLMMPRTPRFMLADSRARVLVVSGAVPEIRQPDRLGPRPRARWSSSGSNARGYRRFEDLMTAAKPDPYLHTTPTTRDDMCFWLYRRARPASRRARCTPANLRLTTHRPSTPPTCWASRRPTSAIRWRSCSSPTGSAMR
jgi:benzoate-CoA ligase